MTTKPKIKSDGRTITVRVPILMRRRGGRKLVITPGGRTDIWSSSSRRVDSVLIKAIARAFRWREMLEAGTHATIREIADAENINSSYVSRTLRLTLLAPQTVEAILDGRQPSDMTLAALMKPFPVRWAEQT